MLAFQFLSQNLNFALNLLAGLVFFAVFWLYFDAWLVKKNKKGMLKWIGLPIISLSFLVRATSVEESLFGGTIFGNKLQGLVAVLRLIGYGLFIAGLLGDKLQVVPETSGLTDTAPAPAKPTTTAPAAIAIGTLVGNIGKVLLPIGSFMIAILYLRRATTGLEKHLKSMAIGFGLIGLHDLLDVSTIWQTSTNPRLYQLVAPFGIVWYAEHLLLLIGVIIIGRWVWQYLTTRVFSQLFMIFITSTITVFLLSTVGFSFLLLKNVQSDALGSLQTAANVLNYALDSKKAESLALAESIASNSDVINAIGTRNHQALSNSTVKLLETKKQSTILITDDQGQVLSRAEDAERWGDSLSEDTAIKQALNNTAVSHYVTKEDVLAPQILVLTSTPVKNTAGKVIGVVRVGLITDNGFLDGVKNTTGLDSAVYAKDTRSATTFIDTDGKSRLIGIRETNKQVKDQVLSKGQVFAAPTTVLNQPILGVYYPLKDARNEVIGMLFVGKPQNTLLQTAGRSIELTFLLSAALMLVSLWPNYLLAKRISKDVR